VSVQIAVGGTSSLNRGQFSSSISRGIVLQQEVQKATTIEPVELAHY